MTTQTQEALRLARGALESAEMGLDVGYGLTRMKIIEALAAIEKALAAIEQAEYAEKARAAIAKATGEQK